MRGRPVIGCESMTALSSRTSALAGSGCAVPKWIFSCLMPPQEHLDAQLDRHEQIDPGQRTHHQDDTNADAPAKPPQLQNRALVGGVREQNGDRPVPWTVVFDDLKLGVPPKLTDHTKPRDGISGLDGYQDPPGDALDL